VSGARAAWPGRAFVVSGKPSPPYLCRGRNRGWGRSVDAPFAQTDFLESFQPLNGACEMLSRSYVVSNQAENPIAA
jgi:hypothetical protein